MRGFCKKYYKWGIALLFIIGVGIAGEVLYNLPVVKQNDYQYLDQSQVQAEGFKVIGEVYVSTGTGGKLELSFDKQYVDKLYYQYDYKGQLYNKVLVNTFGADDSQKKITIRDNNNHIWGASTVNIHQVTDSITILMPKEAEHITIQGIAINNTVNYSIGRILFYSLSAAFILLIISILRGKVNWKPECIFLVVAISAGGLLLITLPCHKVGMDEEIHFGRAFYLFDTFAGKEQITVTPHMNDLITPSMANWPESIAQSKEESKLEKEYWNENLKYDTAKPSNENQENGYAFQLYSFSYLPQALMIKAGELLHLDFTTIYTMGRFGNLILYCVVIFFAIRHIVIGKRIMMILALMPTAMFSAVTYSYDATVTAFSFLGISYLITELADYKKVISYKNCVIFGLALIFASFPKPIYIPMIALALFFPASKFRSKKEKFIFKGVIAAVCLAMLSTFALPPLLNPNQGGDARGGDTSVGRQLRYIFAHPIVYTKLLLSRVGKTFFPFTFGQTGLGGMGHLKMLKNGIPIALLVGYTTITDGKREENKEIKMGHKILMILISFAIMCLIWTALYLSFTPVGEAAIHGVQGRYYLPVTMLLLLALNIKNIRNFMKERIDYAIISTASIVLLMVAIYSSVIVNTF